VAAIRSDNQKIIGKALPDAKNVAIKEAKKYKKKETNLYGKERIK